MKKGGYPFVKIGVWELISDFIYLIEFYFFSPHISLVS